MAKKEKSKEGYFSTINNERGKYPSLKQYKQATIEWDEHRSENYLIFTDSELIKAKERAMRRADLTPQGLPLFNSNTRFGHISYVKNRRKHHREADHYYFVKMRGFDFFSEGWLAFTAHTMDVAILRTSRLKKLIQKKSLITDIFD